MKKVKALMGFFTFTLPSLELLLFQIPVFSKLALVMVLILLQGLCIVPKQEKKASQKSQPSVAPKNRGGGMAGCPRKRA